ncbi:hypothetical protein [Paraburkholderia sp. BCC1876]|uniref:hypothetical protein n=1 Tax=Paraburkholderia sp. BCC1876 TaxID=2676303 RepID=UPI0015914B24|nr:hypothetical protein [Paraburkholderia sp. BCC1876]
MSSSPEKTSERKFFAFAEKILLYPIVPAFSTSSGVIAGYLGAHFDGQIVTSFRPLGLHGWHPAWGATLFWLATVLFSLTFGGTFWAQARSGDRHNKRLEDASVAIHQGTQTLQNQSDEISARVKQLFTLPPLGFLELYEASVRELFDAYTEWDSVDSPGRLEEKNLEVVARTLIFMMMQLAIAFDADSSRATYSANVMVFWPKNFLIGDLAAHTQRRLRMAGEATSVGLLFGVLDCVKELSVNSQDNDNSASVDSSLIDLCLPIPEAAVSNSNDANSAKALILPGAPVAFVSKTVAAVEKQSDLLEHMKDRGFGRDVMEAMAAYIKESKQTRSFISIPIFPSSLESVPVGYSEEQPFAIVNINRNLENQRSAERMALFQPLLEPYRQLFSRVLWAYTVEVLYSRLNIKQVA